MLSKAYRYINDEDVFQLRGSLLDKATFNKMLRMIIKTNAGRDLVCRIGDECEKRGLPIALTMMRLREDALGFCDSKLIVKIANPNQPDFSKSEINRATFNQTFTLTHELGHALQFLKREDRINEALPIKERFYAQVWTEAEADLWARDVEADLSKIYTGLSKNISLLTTRFKSRNDFVRAFFVKGRNYDWMASGVDVVISDLMNARKVILPNAASRSYFPRLMNQRFQRMRLSLAYKDMPLDKCFWVKKLSGGVSMIHNEDGCALVAANGSLLSLCDLERKSSNIQSFGNSQLEYLMDAEEVMPRLSQYTGLVEERNRLPEEPFKITTRQFNALARPSDRFGGRAP